MKKALLFFMLVSLFACKKENESETLENHVIGKWVLYRVDSGKGLTGLAGFKFDDNKTLNVYASTTFGQGQIDRYSWKITEDENIEIRYQSSTDAQGDPAVFPNATQGNSITINVGEDWEDNTSVIHISIYGNNFVLSK